MTRLKHGDILEIPLKNNYGYVYAKLLKPKKIWPDKNYLPDVLRIFNFNSIKPIDSINQIKNRDLLIAPVSIGGSSAILKYGWRIIGTEEIREEDRFLPHVKRGWPPMVPIPEKWVYYEDLADLNKMHFAEYEDVKHLEYSRALHISIVPFRITMELMKLEGKDIKSELGQLDWLEEVEYNDSFNIPPYTRLDASLRGRVK